MKQSRRSLLKMGFLTAASAALPARMLAKSSSKPAAPATTTPASASANDALSTLTAADFKPFVGATFTILGLTTRVTLAEVQNPPTLSAVSNKTTTTPDPRSQTFALRFKSVSGPVLAQGTYTFQNKSIGPFAMFVVPSQAKATPMYYTGQVNRPVQ